MIFAITENYKTPVGITKISPKITILEKILLDKYDTLRKIDQLGTIDNIADVEKK